MQQTAKHTANNKQKAKIQKLITDPQNRQRKAGVASAGDKVREKSRGKNSKMTSHNQTRMNHNASATGVNNGQSMLFQTVDMRKSQFKDSVLNMQTLISTTSSLTAQKPNARAMQRSA